MKSSIIRALPAAAALIAMYLCGAIAARADTANPNDIRLGLYAVFYNHSSADDLQGPAEFTPSGINFHTENLQTLYIGYIRTLPYNLSAELALGYPPLTKTQGQGPAYVGSVPYNGQVISTARWFAPTALLEYNFFTESAPVRPFIGFGVNYVNFYDRQSTSAGDAASGGPTKISLPASWGPAATVGLAVKLADRWHVYASYSGSKVNTRLTADTGGISRTSHIEFNPQAFILSLGFAF
jgi:outer membrane protein